MLRKQGDHLPGTNLGHKSCGADRCERHIAGSGLVGCVGLFPGNVRTRFKSSVLLALSLLCVASCKQEPLRARLLQAYAMDPTNFNVWFYRCARRVWDGGNE